MNVSEVSDQRPCSSRPPPPPPTSDYADRHTDRQTDSPFPLPPLRGSALLVTNRTVAVADAAMDRRHSNARCVTERVGKLA